MDFNQLISVGLPVALFIVMIGMGLSLTLTDFRRVVETPRAVMIGTLGQLLLVPLFGFAAATLFGPGSGVLAAGLVLVSLCPGGTTSNLICYLAKADVALSITLTMLSTLLTIVTIPPLLNLALELFTGDGELIRLSFWDSCKTLSTVILLPTLLGMMLRAVKPGLAQALEPVISKFSGLVLIAVVAAICVSQWDNLPGWLAATIGPVLALNFLCIAGAWLLARGGGVSVPEQLTIMIEMSTQNATVGLLIALNLIGNVELVIPCVAYGLLMYGSATAMVAFGRRQHSALRAVEPQAAVA